MSRSAAGAGSCGADWDVSRWLCRLAIATLLLATFALPAPLRAGFPEGVEAFKLGDYDAALREFRLLAEKGHGRAQYNLGVRYANGRRR